jgi:BRCA1 C Terminus (BRCT) domain
MGHITFANKSQLWLWESELTGQLSDGAWENSNPHDHWKELCRADVSIGTPGMTGVYTKRTYNFGRPDLVNVVGDRMLFVAKAAIAYPNAPDSVARAFNGVGDNLGNLKQYDFIKKYVSEIEKATGEDIKTVIAKVEAVPYTMTNLRRDLKTISDIVAQRPVAAESKEETPKAVSDKPQILAGLTFCITGEFPETRNVITQKLESLGAGAQSSVSQGTKLLIVGDKPGGSKLTRARELGTKQVGIEFLTSTFAKAGIPFGKTGSYAFRAAQAKKLARTIMAAHWSDPVSYKPDKLDKKYEWERVYEMLRDVLDIVRRMDEKPMVQATLEDLIDTAKAQAKLWEKRPGLEGQALERYSAKIQ